MSSDPLLETLRDIAGFLESQEIAFALMGGLAVAVRGEPRSTLDVDLVIDCNVERGLQLVESLATSRFRPLFDGVEEVVRTGLLLPVVHRETGIKVDLALGMSGFDRAAIGESTKVSIAGGLIPVVRAEYLVVMKQLASRPRDVNDIAKILTRQGESFDWQLVLEIAQQLGEAIDDDLVGPLRAWRDRTAGKYSD